MFKAAKLDEMCDLTRCARFLLPQILQQMHLEWPCKSWGADVTVLRV
jgi:hypothetical protein